MGVCWRVCVGGMCISICVGGASPLACHSTRAAATRRAGSRVQPVFPSQPQLQRGASENTPEPARLTREPKCSIEHACSPLFPCLVVCLLLARTRRTHDALTTRKNSGHYGVVGVDDHGLDGPGASRPKRADQPGEHLLYELHIASIPAMPTHHALLPCRPPQPV